jgi:peroxiredoxin
MNDTRNVVVLSFFSTTCEPCKKEIPELHKLAGMFKDKQLKIYLISIDTVQTEEVKNFIKAQGITLPVLFDPYGIQTGKSYDVIKNNVASIPKLYLITKNGYISKIIDGYKEGNLDIIKKDIETLLKETEKPFESEENEITVLFSNSTNGYFKSCDCPSHPFGGLTRRATLIKEIKSKKPNVLVLDTGDLLAPYSTDVMGKYLVKCMDNLKCDVMAIGDQELLLGLDKFKKLMAGATYMEFLSTNLNFCVANDDARIPTQQCFSLTKQYTTKQVGKFKVGIISVISPKCFSFFPRDKKQGLKINDPVDNIKGFVENFRKEMDLVIVLSHSGFDEDKIYAQNTAGVDLIIGGHSQTLLKDPVIENKTVIVQAGEKGQYLGNITLPIDKTTKKVRFNGIQHRLIALTKEIPDDPEILDIIKQYNTELGSNTGSNQKLLIPATDQNKQQKSK